MRLKDKRSWAGRSTRVGLILATVIVPSAITLIWLGLQLLAQDRTLMAQRDVDRRRAAALTAARDLERALAEAETRNPLPAGLIRITFLDDAVRAEPASRVFWLPSPPRLQEADRKAFSEAELREYRGEAEHARSIYLRLSRSRDPAVRAGALLRLARVERRTRQWTPASEAYRQLAQHGDIAIEGTPADLVARRARCEVLEEAGQLDLLRTEATALESDWLAGRWMLDHAAWALTAADIERWTGRPVTRTGERAMFSDVAARLWTDRMRLGESTSSTVEIPAGPDGHVTVVWRRSGASRTAMAISPQFLRDWIRDRTRSAPSATGVSVLAVSGRTLAGPDVGGDAATVRVAAAETGLPWTLAVSPDPALQVEWDRRRRQLMLGLISIVLLLGGGGLVLWRLFQREVALARLQTEFVAAVSHEFRTPLTSLRHVTELLEERDEMPPERRKSFYEALGRNTDRLQRLVESLLDFSRMEGGRKPYDLRLSDTVEIVSAVVADFRKEVERRGVTIALDVDSNLPPVLADASTLSHAVWNLLENAVKYSPDAQRVCVSVERHRAGVAIAVSDRGLGVPVEERRLIFQRFVRGATASRLGIKGTGLGLAIVSHIVAAHGGRIELDSAVNEGSTFRIVLPAAPAGAGGTVEPWLAS